MRGVGGGSSARPRAPACSAPSARPTMARPRRASCRSPPSPQPAQAARRPGGRRKVEASRADQSGECWDRGLCAQAASGDTGQRTRGAAPVARVKDAGVGGGAWWLARWMRSAATASTVRRLRWTAAASRWKRLLPGTAALGDEDARARGLPDSRRLVKVTRISAQIGSPQPANLQISRILSGPPNVSQIR